MRGFNFCSFVSPQGIFHGRGVTFKYGTSLHSYNVIIGIYALYYLILNVPFNFTTESLVDYAW
jgi:hypothetical protein